MKKNRRWPRSLIVFLSLLGLAALVLFLYYASIPEKYELKVGDASPYDINAQRSIPDQAETELRARKAAADVPNVMLRSQAVSERVRGSIDAFFAEIDAIRAKALPVVTPAVDPTPELTPTMAPEATPTPAGLTRQQMADQIVLVTNQRFKFVLNADDALLLASLDDDRYASISGHVRTIASLLMSETLDISQLQTSLSEKIDSLKTALTYYPEDAGIVNRILSLFLKPNVVFDEQATENARKAAYDKVLNNPVMIERGSRIISEGDIITSDTFALLQELDLVADDRFDTVTLSGIILLLLITGLIGVLFISRFEPDTFRQPRDRMALVLIMALPIVFSAYSTRISSMTPPVYFAAILITAYFGFRSSVIMSILLALAILPLTGFDVAFLMTAITGSIVAALFTKGVTLKNNYAVIILMTGGTVALTSIAYGLLMKEAWPDLTLRSGYAAVAGILSAIAAIGIMPLFEMIFNAVSPLRLIELSQPSHPLMRRLFVEAPGSSQHSMMVANLADTAADAIGANAMLARVAAYYHDIGKLENPQMFTENQEGENPHDELTPEESAEIILAHPEAGVRIGKRYRLPAAILRIIHEHHGSTSQVYFFRKAQRLAENEGRPLPEPHQYQYRCPMPSSRESAIVMLADSGRGGHEINRH